MGAWKFAIVGNLALLDSRVGLLTGSGQGSRLTATGCHSIPRLFRTRDRRTATAAPARRIPRLPPPQIPEDCSFRSESRTTPVNLSVAYLPAIRNSASPYRLLVE